MAASLLIRCSNCGLVVKQFNEIFKYLLMYRQSSTDLWQIMK